MRVLNVFFVLALIISGASFVSAQKAHAKSNKQWRMSDAYALLVKERAKARGSLYEAEQRLTAQTPQVKAAKLRLALINREMKKIKNVRNANKYSAAYGDLLLTKVQFEVELYEMRQRFTPEHVAVKKKEVELKSLKDDLKLIAQNFR